MLQFLPQKNKLRMKYVLSSVRKGNTRNMMEKTGYVKFNT